MKFTVTAYDPEIEMYTIRDEKGSLSLFTKDYFDDLIATGRFDKLPKRGDKLEGQLLLQRA